MIKRRWTKLARIAWRDGVPITSREKRWLECWQQELSDPSHSKSTYAFRQSPFNAAQAF
jgi:hypothetical protein